VARLNLPTLVLAPNKTLAAQLYGEFQEFFPDNAVEYFVSYYDYYQPEAYVPQADLYIEKDSSINEAIDRMRHSATRSLFDRQDVIIVASVSCIYGLGSPEAYHGMLLSLEEGAVMDRREVLKKLVEILYERNDIDFHRGTFRVRGDRVEIFPAYEEDRAIRVDFWGDTVEAIREIDPLRGQTLRQIKTGHDLPRLPLCHPGPGAPPGHGRHRGRVGPAARLVPGKRQIAGGPASGGAHPLRPGDDEGTGLLPRHRELFPAPHGPAPGEPPLPSWITCPGSPWWSSTSPTSPSPNSGGCFEATGPGSRPWWTMAFRLPSALDNRPLCFEEFEARVRQIIYVSATPAPYEVNQAEGRIVEQIVRPTGLMDPRISVKPAANQVDDLLGEIRARLAKGERVLVTTLTKRMAEDLTEYYQDLGLKVRYLHSDITTLERMDILRDLRLGVFHVLIGINLLREGLDLPEVSLVAILDADKEGFLRSARSLIQTCGRAARNVNGQVLFYADRVTPSMAAALEETNRRRSVQEVYNREHDITPETIQSRIKDVLASVYEADYVTVPLAAEEQAPYLAERPEAAIKRLKKEMRAAAKKQEFERAATLRDRIRTLEAENLKYGG